jgi:membrane protein DedA with SNARE-associated domain
MSHRNFSWRAKAPQLLIIAVIAIALGIVLFDTLEDVLLESGGFSGTPLAVLLNAVATLTESVTAAVQSWGYVGVCGLMVLESSSLPIPSEIILPFAGFLVSQGLLSFWLVVLVSTFAGLVGALIDYYIGLKGLDLVVKRKRLRNMVYNQGRMATVERWFQKYGASVVFLSRLVPGFRTLISFPAGAVRMSLAKFVAYTTAGCVVWNAVLVYVGFYVGARWREVAGVVHYLIITATVAVLVGVVLFWVSRRKRLQKQQKLGLDC